jgi:hypothetical protein
MSMLRRFAAAVGMELGEMFREKRVGQGENQ